MHPGKLNRPSCRCYHATSQVNYARHHPAEAVCAAKRRCHPAAMLLRLLRAMTLCKPCAEPALRATAHFHDGVLSPACRFN